jgi:hypothetical protein
MALTAAQFREHVGRFMLQGMAADVAHEDGLFSVNLRTIMRWAKEHRSDTGFSNPADRTEAATRFLRELFQRTSGRDSEANALNRRLFRKWLDMHLTYGDGIAFEPAGQ